MITLGKGAEYALLQKLAASLKIPKNEFKRESMFTTTTGEELPVYMYPVIEERASCNFNPIFYSVSLGHGDVNLAQLVDPVKWGKSPLRQAFVDGEGYLTTPGQKCRYALSVQLVGMVWMVTVGQTYATPARDQFLGAVIVRDPSYGVAVIQPVKNYISECLGLPESSED